jgi:hypothetical protein
MAARPRLAVRLGVATALLALLVAAVAGCASLDPFQRKKSWEESHKRFTQYMRWGKISAASRYVDPELRAEFLSLAPEITDMYFTDYEILHADIDDGWETAVVDVRISGYRASWPVERSHVITEEWRREGLEWLVRLDMESLREAIAPGNR